MKKMRKLLAVLMTLAMVMGLGMTSFAADEGLNIPVSNAEDATFQHAQLIKIDETTETGWEFVSTAVANAYISVLNPTGDSQDVLWMLIKNVAGDTAVPGMPEGTEKADDSEIAEVLRNIKNANPAIITLLDGKTVTAPGVYYIDAQEDGYVYNAMAAYVSFGPYEDGVPNGLECSGIIAKKADDEIEKTNNNGDVITEIGRVVEYTITTTVPYIAADNDLSYVITDTISGATYENVAGGKVKVSVKVGNGTATDMYADLNGTNSWSLNLDTVTAGNTNAGKTLVLTYSAKVTDMVVHNNATTNDGDHSDSTDNFLFAGSATITKVDVNNTELKLDGAEFVVKKDGKFATFTEIEEEDVVTGYKLSGWVDTLEAATHIVTGTADNGAATVYGLDSSETYQFVEVIAPTGYSVNEIPENIQWGTPEEKDATLTVGDVTVTYKEVTVEGFATMKDTKLSGLPSTGGIGTTIFTIGGCAIMVAAAYMFFASRRREDEQ